MFAILLKSTKYIFRSGKNLRLSIAEGKNAPSLRLIECELQKNCCFFRQNVHFEHWHSCL